MLKITKEKRVIKQFDSDALLQGGYLYTTNAPKSSHVANRRLTQTTQSNLTLKFKKVIDVGCGDGTYTYELYSWGKPELMVGIDSSAEAINIARKKYAVRKSNLIFKIESCYKISCPKKSFDVAIARGALHHLDYPQRALEEVFRIAKEILILEPNGYNPVLKIIERFSKYHRRHGEKSYRPSCLRAWIKNLDGQIKNEEYVGLVPFFAPDWLVKLFKRIEPVVEKTPLLRNLLCGVYVVKVKTSEP